MSNSIAETRRLTLETPRFSLFRVFFATLIGWYLALLGTAVGWGLPYYFTAFQERPFHPLHAIFKPSGLFGRTLGLTGTAFIVLSFLYFIRKRNRFLQKIGDHRLWLQFHIFLGLSGPSLIALHTTGKLSGIAAIAFYSMAAMVLSGLIGRYLYSRIPRTKKGSEMNLKQIEERFCELAADLGRGECRDEILQASEEFLAGVRKRSGGLASTFLRALGDDLSAPINFWRAWRIARLQPGAPLLRRVGTCRLILRQRRLLKLVALLEATQQLFSYWHVFHKPFTVLGGVLMAAHITVATYLGYGLGW